MGFLKLEACLSPRETADFDSTYTRLIVESEAHDYFAAPPGAVAVATRPGDVVLFDTRIWHAAPAGPGGRRNAFIQYVPDPGDSALRQQQVRAAIPAFPYADHLIETAGPERQAMVGPARTGHRPQPRLQGGLNARQ